MDEQKAAYSKEELFDELRKMVVIAFEESYAVDEWDDLTAQMQVHFMERCFKRWRGEAELATLKAEREARQGEIVAEGWALIEPEDKIVGVCLSRALLWERFLPLNHSDFSKYEEFVSELEHQIRCFEDVGYRAIEVLICRKGRG